MGSDGGDFLVKMVIQATKKVSENFGLHRTHETELTYVILCDVTEVSTAAAKAQELGFRVTAVYQAELDSIYDSVD